MCFLFISEQTATFVPYNLNWLVFITDMKSVYCVIRIGSFNKTVYDSVGEKVNHQSQHKHNYSFSGALAINSKCDIMTC